MRALILADREGDRHRGAIARSVAVAAVAVFVATAGYPVGAEAVGDPGAEPGGESLLGTPATDVADAVAEITHEDRRPHVAALAGILVLAVLGGTLIARNRLDGGANGGAHPPRKETVPDRDRVRRLVADNGGRMRQSAIVEEVEWSKAKVSRLLADLESEEEITKLRIGRENLICLPGREPHATRPPHAGDR